MYVCMNLLTAKLQYSLLEISELQNFLVIAFMHRGMLIECFANVEYRAYSIETIITPKVENEILLCFYVKSHDILIIRYA